MSASPESSSSSDSSSPAAAGAAASSPSSSYRTHHVPLRTPSNLSTEEAAQCDACASYLRAALSSPNSRPVELLRAMGAASSASASASSPASASATDSSDGGRRLFEEDEDGRGVRVTIPSSMSSNATSSEEETRAGGGSGDGGGLMRRISSRLRASPVVDVVGAAGGASSTIAATSPPSSEATAVLPLASASSARPLPLSLSISCSPCSDTGPEGSARAYVKGPSPLGVVLCSNRLSSPDEIIEALVHELVHVYDVTSKQLDLRDCRHLAYSEVRAAREAECHGSHRWRKSSCVRNKAGVATGNMFGERVAKECVCDVFEAAMADRSPFVGGGSGNGTAAGGGAGGSTSPTKPTASISVRQDERGGSRGFIDGRPYSSSYSRSFLEGMAEAAATARSSSSTGFASSSSSSSSRR